MPGKEETIYRARYILIDGRFEQNLSVVAHNNEITAILRDGDDRASTGLEGKVVDLGDVALLPGQINVHSHAFQRSLRGKTEYRRSTREQDDFWSWRTEMYALANRIEPEEMMIIARMAYLEMARCGITHVGEFHYVHHRPDGQAYGEPNELAYRIGAAAQEAGIRLTMLPVAYHTGAIGTPARSEQRRFVHSDVETYLENAFALGDQWSAEPLLDVGLAPHSIRAVPKAWLETIAAEASAASIPVHIHVCEQRQEIAASIDAYGMPPVEALHHWGVLDESWTLIHGTHLSQTELEILGDVRPTIGACPTTERNLGDGFLPVQELMRRQVPIALGSDSHTVIDPFEEMRLVEYHERLRAEERNILAGLEQEVLQDTASILWPMGTTHGARSLHSEGGSIREGGPADLVSVDLGHPSLAGASSSTLLTDVVLSMSAGAVQDVIVGGEAVVTGGRHRQEDEIIGNYRRLMRTYAGDIDGR